MSRRFNAIFLLILFILPSLVLGYNWPIKEFAGPHPIHGTLGEWRSGHLHKGVDIGCGVNTPVYAIDSDKVQWINVIDEEGIIIGNKKYIHLVPGTRIANGTEVTAGQKIGETAITHLHFSENNGAVNPLIYGGLDNFSDTSDPTINEIEVVKQGSGDSFPETAEGIPIVSGEVDIKANVKDSMSSGSPVVAPYKVGYEIKTEAGQTIVSENFKIVFNTISGYSLSLIYASDSTKSNYIYWVTNSPTQNEYWDTTGLPDGEYKIKVIVEDIGRPSVNKAEKEITVIKDDYPFLEQVSVEGVDGYYDAYWIQQSDTERRLKVDEFEVFRPGDAEIRLEFSEDMDTTYSPVVEMKVNEIQISVEHTLGWISDDTWVGRCELPKEEGEVNIRVSGVRDLKGNEIDGEPSTIAYCTVNGGKTWHDHLPNVDENHWFYLTYKRIVIVGQMRNFMAGAYSRIVKTWDDDFTGYEKPGWNQEFTGTKISAGKMECKDFKLSVSIYDASVTEDTRFRFNLLGVGGGVKYRWRWVENSPYSKYDRGWRHLVCWIRMYNEDGDVIGGGEKDIYYSFDQIWACEDYIKIDYSCEPEVCTYKEKNPDFAPANGILANEVNPYEMARQEGINPNEVAFWDVRLDMMNKTAGYWMGYSGDFDHYDMTWFKYGIEGLEEVLKDVSSSDVISKEKGGRVTCGRVTLDIPPDALPVDGFVEITEEQGEILKRMVRPIEPWEDYFYNIVVYDINHQQVKENFLKAAILTISYQDSPKTISYRTNSNGGRRDFSKWVSLDIYHFYPEANIWELEGGSENLPQEEKVKAPVTSLGMYAIMGYIRPAGSLDDLTNYPNPFAAGRENTTIQYYLEEDSDVMIAIYDLMGNLVKTFSIDKGEEGGQGGGLNTVDWNGKNGRRDVVANGGYICRVEIDSGQRKEYKIRKILVVK